MLSGTLAARKCIISDFAPKDIVAQPVIMVPVWHAETLWELSRRADERKISGQIPGRKQIAF